MSDQLDAPVVELSADLDCLISGAVINDDYLADSLEREHHTQIRSQGGCPVEGRDHQGYLVGLHITHAISLLVPNTASAGLPRRHAAECLGMLTRSSHRCEPKRYTFERTYPDR